MSLHFEVIQTSPDLHSPLLRATWALGLCQGSFGTESGDSGGGCAEGRAGVMLDQHDHYGHGSGGHGEGPWQGVH